MKKVEMWEASNGEVFPTEHACQDYEKKTLLEKRLRGALEHEAGFTSYEAQDIAEKLVRWPDNLKAVLNVALLQQLFAAGEPMDNEVVFVAAFKFPHHSGGNDINRERLQEYLNFVMQNNRLQATATILDVVVGGFYEDE